MKHIALTFIVAALLVASAAEAKDKRCYLDPLDEALSRNPCDLASEAVETDEIRTLQRIVIEKQVSALARLMAAERRTASIDEFVYDPGPLTIVRLCCTCVPGDTCSVNDVFDVCEPATGTQCPAGTIRTLCTGSSPNDAFCTGID